MLSAQCFLHIIFHLHVKHITKVTYLWLPWLMVEPRILGRSPHCGGPGFKLYPGIISDLLYQSHIDPETRIELHTLLERGHSQLCNDTLIILVITKHIKT